MFHLNAPSLLDNLVGLSLELHHWRQVGGNRVGGPHLCMDDAVKGPAQLLDCAQAGQ